jgi:hypothetical protein
MHIFGFFKQEVVWSFEESIFQLYKLWGGSYNYRCIGEFISWNGMLWFPFKQPIGVVSLEVPIGMNSFIVTKKKKEKNVLIEHE